MPLRMEVGLGSGHIVIDGYPVRLSQKGGGAPQFSAHICCGQMAGWIKMPLGTEVGLGPATLMGSQLYPAERCTAPSFRPKSIVATVAHLSYC